MLHPIEHLLISCNFDKVSLIGRRSFNESAAQDSPTLTIEATHLSPLKAMLFLFLLLLSSLSTAALQKRFIILEKPWISNIQYFTLMHFGDELVYA